jgi:hypothetical protein
MVPLAHWDGSRLYLFEKRDQVEVDGWINASVGKEHRDHSLLNS